MNKPRYKVKRASNGFWHVTRTPDNVKRSRFVGSFGTWQSAMSWVNNEVVMDKAWRDRIRRLVS